ncbi:ricin-type beta-trefoil lectin domain protein [Streptomyces sp. BE20]|uniref:ricin-type beta-trefoil lectin domain protein n=1 Tax=Streptomyces sp. BE20 TaxID=3002525 RepID=UPI002E77A0AB|nr:ricin-type beta-trefoil lectin domain protein [Streptomyces sp. BE20]MEE1825002.1 ricin-type beta-trefoil lectin domain protein [Streptomyces sp. BE20]
MRRAPTLLAALLLAVAAALAAPSAALASDPGAAGVPAAAAAAPEAPAASPASAPAGCRTYAVIGEPRQFGECTGIDPLQTWTLQAHCAWTLSGRVYDFYVNSSVIVGNTATSVDCSPGHFVDVRILLGYRLPPEEAGPVLPPGPITGLAGTCMELRNGSPEDGTKVQISDCTGAAGQIWRLPVGGTVKALGKCMDAVGGGTANGTKVQLLLCNGTAAQQWYPMPDGQIVNPQSNRCLTVPGADPTNGNQLVLRDCAGGAGQRWVLPS